MRQAVIQLGYTKIRSPIKGKSGVVAVKAGDLVVANALTPLVTINKLDPILADFSLTQRELKDVLTYQKRGTLQVEVAYEDENKVFKDGELIFIDNTINNQTGTVLLKARVKNRDNTLWPGMMVAISLILTIEPHAMVVPTSAIQVDEQGHFVYCLEDNKVKIHRVEVSRQVQDLSVIAQGLKGIEKVITSVPPNLAEGDLVHIVAPSLSGDVK
jgi:multidrug efflux system membrane fusion protein